jgi:hypothetical protein
MSAGAGSGTVPVTAPSGCAWTAASNASWLTIASGQSGSGNGSVAFNATANVGPSRTGTLTIAGKTFTVTQTSGCTFTLNPVSFNADKDGDTGSFTVTTAAGCTWTAASQNSWITVTSGASGTGNGTVQFSVARNGGGARNGSILVNTVAFAIHQQKH